MTAIAIPRPPTLSFRGPSLRDPRLHTASVLLTIQALGQTVLGFRLSIAQLLISLATSVILEVALTVRRERVVAWPASAMLTGNGVALILRVPGTAHGEWWSLRGWWWFAGVSALALLSKYVIRIGGRHIFNPANFGLVVAFLVLGSDRVEPLDFWWGPPSVQVGAAIAVIVFGGIVILTRLRVVLIAGAFWVTFAASLLVVARSGHCMTAAWHVGPVCNREFWLLLITSPEVMIFLFFMITDPRTIPTTPRSQIAFGAAIAMIASLLIAPQRTEFGAKVGLLSALLIVCALRAIIERVGASERWVGCRRVARRRMVVAAPLIAVAAIVGLVAGGIPARPVALRSAAARVAFPAVAASELPTLRIAPDDLSVQISTDDAQSIARSVVQNLAVQIDLLRRRDATQVRAIADRSWLEHLESQMQDAARTREIDVTRYRIDAIVVSVARRQGQSAPAVLASLFGERSVERYRDGVDRPVRVAPYSPLSGTTFEVLWDGARYVIISDQLPEGFTPPLEP